MTEDEKRWGSWIVWGAIMWVVLLLLLSGLQARSQELPGRPQGDIIEHEGRKLLCYDEDNARLIAHWVTDFGPMIYERNLLLQELVDNYVDSLHADEQLVYQLDLQAQADEGRIEVLEEQVSSLKLVLAAETKVHKRRERLHWFGHILSVGALTGTVLWGATR